ncbi:ABC transporter substrate-binding protein [Clostridium oryzae]|uniref:Multiple sugar-binding protein n=1 Tax=Clostridium oryzae TaxID=1450648 RepID=A0A1V4ITT4_9CLOT|nr:extracellular solute-binding protein [Clostridium oryzae]OPJ63451.1 multiple sugar-binding protein precursor [Clostridium oryzae]
MKKSRIKKSLVAFLCLATTMSLFAGCQSSSSSSSGKSTTAKKENLTIMHYLVEKGKLKALNDTVAGFKKKYPNVDVTIQGMSLDQYSNTLNMKISAGDMPDVMFGSPKTYSDIVKSGNIMDITDKDFTSRVDKDAIKCAEVDGKVYGIPMDLMLSGVIYNKDIFKKYNIQTPKTWSEFVNVMKTLKQHNVTPVAAGYKDLASVGGSYWCQLFGSGLAQMPTMRADIMSGAKKPSDYPVLKQFLTQWKTINQYTSNATQVGVDRSEQEFGSGRAGMIIIGSWAVSAIRSYAPNGNFGSFVFPFFDDASKNKMQYNTDDTWMLSSKSANQKTALKFFDYMTSKEAASTWATDVPAVSAITGAKADKLDPILDDMNAALTSGAAYNAMAETAFSGQSATVWDAQMQSWAFTSTSSANADLNKYLSQLDKAMANARTTGK